MLNKYVNETVDDIKRERGELEPDEKKSIKQTDELIKLFYAQNSIIFRDEMDEAYVQITVAGVKQIKRCESKQFEKYLHHIYWEETGNLISSENLLRVVRLIAAKAIYNSEQFKLHNRVAYHDSNFWIDLGKSKAVCIRKGTWDIVEDVPILFRSFQHQETQLLPTLGSGDVKKILGHIHINNKDHQILFLVWLVAAFIPDISHAILVLFGGQGSAKSTTMKFARQLIDPSKAGLLSLPNADEILQQLAHHYTPFYDNVNKIYQNTSDILCRAVTGSGSSKRRLFTDDDDVIYQYRRVIALNGINNVVENPDLHDRSIMIECNRICKEDRKTENIVNAAFEADRPYILGGILDVLAKARILFDNVVLQELPRMADFAKWGYAISEALGFGGETFLKAYAANISQQNEEVLENDTVAHAICHLIEENSEWEGTPTELYEKLLGIAGELKLDLKFMPKTPAILGRRINIVLSNLLEGGITVKRHKDTSTRRGRYYRIYKTTVASVSTVAEPDVAKSVSDASDACDGTKRKIEEIDWNDI